MSSHTIVVPMFVVPGDAPFAVIPTMRERLFQYGWKATVSPFLVNGEPLVGKLMSKFDGEVRIDLSKPGMTTDGDAQTAVNSALNNAGLTKYVIADVSAKIQHTIKEKTKDVAAAATEAAGSALRGAVKGAGVGVTTGVVVTGLLLAAVVTGVAVLAWKA